MSEESDQQTRNANKKARSFDFEAILKETIHGQQLRNAENQKTVDVVEQNDATTSESVEERLAAVSIPRRDGTIDEVS